MIATTRGALIRGTQTENSLGDVVEGVEKVAGFENFPMSLIERPGSEYDEASLTWRAVRKLSVRVPPNVPVQPGDRIQDLRDGRIYDLDRTTRTPRGLGGRASVTLGVRLTTP